MASQQQQQQQQQQRRPLFNPIEEVYKFTSFHPTFHTLLSGCWDYIFEAPGALARADRHYLGLMAASRHRCLSLMDFHRRCFLQNGGEADWLLGIDNVDSRYQKVDLLNRILAHQPWQMNWRHIADLIGRGSPDPVNFFTLAQLHQAICILMQTHAMCTIVSAVGLERRTNLAQAEIDFLNIDDERYWAQRDVHKQAIQENENYHQDDIETLIRRMKAMDSKKKKQAGKDHDDGEKTTASDWLDSSSSGDEAKGASTPSSVNNEENVYPTYSHEPKFAYCEFCQRTDKDIRPFRIEEFTWDHAFNVIREFSFEIASRFDRMFDHIRRLTYNHMGPVQHVDTTNYREAVWNYSQGIYAVRFDDYDYGNINQMLDRNTKVFIKLASVSPHKLTNEYSMAMNGLKDSEKVHVIMLVACARFQASILHYSRAVCNYNTQCMSKKGWKRPLD